MTGHIRRRGTNSWELKFETGPRDPATGERRTTTRTIRGGTKREAQAKLIELLGEASRGSLTDYSRETLGEFLIRWDRDWAAHGVGLRTRERWRQLAKLQIVPHLGTAPIQRVKPRHLVELYATLLREGSVSGGPLAAKTVGHVHRLLRRALGHALAWGIIQQNPAAIARPPHVPDTEVEIPSEEEITTTLKRLKDRNRQLYVLAVVTLASGVRRGELCALCWKDFDGHAGLLKIERALETTTAEGLRIKAPKTKHGRRTVSLSTFAIEALRDHWKAQGAERLALGRGRAAPDNLIFAMPDGSPLRPNTLSKEWLRATTIAVGRPISLHSLRHHHASNLIRAGVDILSISRRLGHASAAITLGVYGHLYPSADDKAARAIEEILHGCGRNNGNERRKDNPRRAASPTVWPAGQ
jgi:integrase